MPIESILISIFGMNGACAGPMGHAWEGSIFAEARLSASRSSKGTAMTDIVFRGGVVVDGTGAPPRTADVLVQNGRITEVGSVRARDPAEVIDASGCYVAPGFIDFHTHLDPSLFWDPLSDPLPQHGVTSAVIGNCSLSLAPLRPENRSSMCAAFSHVEDIPQSVFDDVVPWTWESFPEYLNVMKRGGAALNLGALVGHSPLRLFVMGAEAWERPATVDEINRMCQTLEISLDSGGIGLSTSFFDQDANGRPVPSRFAADDELEALVGVLHQRKGLLEFVPNLAGDYDEDLRRIGRVCAGRDVIATYTGGTTYFSRDPELHRHRLAVVEECWAKGASLYPQLSPRTVDVRINWERSMAFQTLAEGWQRVINATPEGKLALLTDESWRAVARREWDTVPWSPFPVKFPHNIRLIGVSDEANSRWVGRTLADLIDERGGHPSDVLADWVLENKLAPPIVAIGVLNDNDDAVAEILAHPATLIGSSDAGAHLGMICAYGDTTLILTKFVRDRADMTIETAVFGMTGRLAQILGWKDRGVIAPGAAADITVFALDELEYLPDYFIDDIPGGDSRLRRPPGGFRSTLTNGTMTQCDGELTGERPGQILSRYD